MIRAFLGAIAMLLVAGGGPVGPATRVLGPSARVVPAATARSSAEGAFAATNSTPGSFPLPQLGAAAFTCNRNWAVKPVFDLGRAIATEEVTIRAGAISRRNFAPSVFGRVQGRPVVEPVVSRAEELALPSGDYRSVSFTVRQRDEAREIVAQVRAKLVAGTFVVRGVRGRVAACYVKRWSVQMDVSPN